MLSRWATSASSRSCPSCSPRELSGWSVAPTWCVETSSSVAPNCLGLAWRAGRRGFKSWACPNSKHPQIGRTITGHNTGQGKSGCGNHQKAALPWSWDSDSDLDGPATQVGRSERSCPVTQVDAFSDEEVLVSSNGRRVVPRTEHEFPTSGTAPASSQALARVQPVSRAVENGNDEEQLCIGQHRNVCARIGDSHDRAEPQELPTVSASLVRGNFARGPAVDVQNRFGALREDGEVAVGEASNPGNRNLIFRRRRRARSAVVESDRMVELANTVDDSEILEAHRLTESDGTESIASSGFLNMFGRDLERASVSVRADTERDVMDDDESLVSGRSGASHVSGGGLSEEAQEEEPEDPTPTVQLGTQTLRRGLESLDEVNLSEVWKIRGHLMKSVPNFMQGVYTTAMRQALDFVSLGEDRGDQELQSMAWKLSFLFPRMFLFRPCRRGRVPKKTLMARLGLFQDGQWVELVEMSLVSSVQAVNERV